VDFECSIVDSFHWSPGQIDESDIESLIPIVFRYPQWKRSQKSEGTRQQVYADDVDFL
jgi:hypothetical protein